MKLLVAVQALMGIPIARFMTGTLSIPPPMPSSPLATPATYPTARPSLVLETRYATSRPSERS